MHGLSDAQIRAHLGEHGGLNLLQEGVVAGGLHVLAALVAQHPDLPRALISSNSLHDVKRTAKKSALDLNRHCFICAAWNEDIQDRTHPRVTAQGLDKYSVVAGRELVKLLLVQLLEPHSRQEQLAAARRRHAHRQTGAPAG